jgi:hypothetical protein
MRPPKKVHRGGASIDKRGEVRLFSSRGAHGRHFTPGFMTEDIDARRRAFSSNAPQLRAALVAELADCVVRAPTLTADEASVIRHVIAYAGFTESGDLRIPGLSLLWGEEKSYVPAVRLPPEVVRAAVRLLVRRGVFQAVGAEVALDAAAVRGLTAPVLPLSPLPASVDAQVSRARRAPKKRARPAPVRAKKKKR